MDGSVDVEAEVGAGESVADRAPGGVELEDGVLVGGLGVLAHELGQGVARLSAVVEGFDEVGGAVEDGEL